MSYHHLRSGCYICAQNESWARTMHGHHHDHPGHSHAPADFGRAFAIGILLNVGFVAIEAFYGLMSGSLALLADAGHNLSDVLSLVVAWAGVELAKRKIGRASCRERVCQYV